MRSLRWLALAMTLGLLAPVAQADVKPHPLFVDHMVLQRDAEVPVWGTADPKAKVTVSLTVPGGKARTAEATADDKGNWKAKLSTQGLKGTGFTLNITCGDAQAAIRDVAIGEVWVCGGQSNMQWEFWRLNLENQGEKVSAAANNPNIRLFTVPRRSAETPMASFTPMTFQRTPQHKAEYGKWELAQPASVLEFSAVGYYFGRDLQKALDVPVGLIACNWGGTPAEAWTSREALAANPQLKHYIESFDTRLKTFDAVRAEEAYKQALAKYKEAAAAAKAEGKPAPRPPARQIRSNQNSPTTLYNGMLASIIPYGIKGAIWYQGESNASRAAEYYALYPTMIQDWRKQWGYDFTFLASQLAPFQGVQGSQGVDYAEVRDALFQATKTLPKVGVAVITDAGDERDIHPQQKEPVGARLALAALAIEYGKDTPHSGPLYKSHTIDGDKVTITFDHVHGGLVCKGDELHGFTVCGEDQKFHPAQAKIDGDKVVVTCSMVSKPVAVRFGWVNFAKPELNFFNKAGLPAVPFRTDNFPLTTAKK